MSDPGRPGRCAILGRGRAGRSFAGALAQVGWTVDLVSSRTPEESSLDVVDETDLVLLAVSDGAIEEVSDRLARLRPNGYGVVAHVSGACGLDVLSAHRRVGSLHPLMSLPDADTGRRRLLDHCTFAVDGDPLVTEVAHIDLHYIWVQSAL